MNKGIIFLTLFAQICFYSCNRVQAEPWKPSIEVSKDTIPCELVLGRLYQGMLIIKNDVDLGNKLCCLPKDVTLSFQGGVIKNGTLVGDGTKIESNGVCFDRVRILGTWNVPKISTSLFKDLDYDNSLKDVAALANPGVENRIVIEGGDYQLSAQSPGDVCLPIYSNTHLTLNGTVRMVPNGYKHYYIFRMRGKNIRMDGNGIIIGDKHTHTGNEGEWGMGIDVLNAHDVVISGLTIKDCWGDCIYVGERSTNVLIEGCLLDNGRRQGVSITSADGVTIRNCTITNVGGTNPEYAIDVEPNRGGMVDHVTIEKVTVKDCIGGFVVSGRAENARVGTVAIRNCQVVADKKKNVVANKCDTIIVQNCDITQHNRSCIKCKDVGHVVIRNNTFHYDKGLFSTLKDWASPKLGKKRVEVMEIEDCGTTVVTGNQEREL